jgi:hypothetical protein
VTREKQENRRYAVWTEIPTENLRNTSLGCYRYTDLFSEDHRLQWDNTEIKTGSLGSWSSHSLAQLKSLGENEAQEFGAI